MKVAYIDCPAGISGDMILGAIVDSGVSLDQLRTGMSALPIGGYVITSKKVIKNGISATQVEIEIQDNVTERSLKEILAIVEQNQLPGKVKEKALSIFKRIGRVEAEIHGVEVDNIHLHELGGQDTIIDVMGALLGLNLLGVEKVYASPLPLAIGYTQSTHGTLPLPAPATLALLEGIPIRGSDLAVELVTPTGAGILTNLTNEFGSIPAMRLLRIGYGAGKMDLPIPNVLRLLIGEKSEEFQAASPYPQEKLVCLETNIDNMNPEIYSYLTERLFEAGALDVTLTPIFMKKNRPGTLLSVLCTEEIVETILNVLFSETTTLGIRRYSVNRYFVEREIIQVSTQYGNVKVKLSKKGEKSWDCAPEYEDCRILAKENQVPIKTIYQAAEYIALKTINNQKI